MRGGRMGEYKKKREPHQLENVLKVKKEER